MSMPAADRKPTRSRVPSRRAPGRPAAATVDQREALLDAAKLRFAANGFAGASLRDITRDARVTPALAGYYFKDKAGLLAAVIEHRIAPLVQELGTQVAAAGPDPLAMLRAFAHTYSGIGARNPWLPQLMVREVLNDQGVLRDTFVKRFASGMTDALRAIVQRGQQCGQLRADLDVAQTVMSLISLCIFPYIATPLVSGVLGIKTDARHASALAEHHLAVLFDGIRRSE
jgi:AcrR family transcriptional regulator